MYAKKKLHHLIAKYDPTVLHVTNYCPSSILLSMFPILTRTQSIVHLKVSACTNFNEGLAVASIERDVVEMTTSRDDNAR